MYMLYLILALVALLIGIWMVCQYSSVPRSSQFLTGLAIVLLSLCHVMKHFPQGHLRM